MVTKVPSGQKINWSNSNYCNVIILLSNRSKSTVYKVFTCLSRLVKQTRNSGSINYNPAFMQRNPTPNLPKIVYVTANNDSIFFYGTLTDDSISID